MKPADSHIPHGDAAAADQASEFVSTGQFQWPPRQVPEEGSANPQARTYTAATTDIQPKAQTPQSAQASVLINWLKRSEQMLLRPTIEPIQRQIRDLNWHRDPVDAYCNRCGRTVGPAEEDEFGCSVCRSRVLTYARVIRLAEYREPIENWVWALKFHRLRPFGEVLGRELGRAAIEAGAMERTPHGGVVVQPVPTSRRRRIQRGIDHAAVIAHALAAELGVPMVNALSRGHRPSQRSMSDSERWANVSGSIRVRRGAEDRIAGKRVLVIDDVLTTGATARAATLALTGRPDARFGPSPWAAAEVWHLVLAVAD